MNCTLCSKVLDERNDSAEHIIPNSIGGRKKVKGFLCISCNSRCGDTWDKALAEQMNPLSLLFKIKRDRGNTPSQRFETIKGDKIVLNHDGSMDIPAPEVKQQQTSEGLAVHIKARSPQETRKILSGLKRKYPSLDVEDFLTSADYQSYYLNDPLKISFAFGGDDAFKSAVKSALALAAHVKIPHQSCQIAIDYLTNPNSANCIGKFFEHDLVLNRPAGEIFHCVAIEGDPQTRLLKGYVEYFGVQRLVILLADDFSGAPIETAYCINPTNGKELDLKIDLEFSRSELEDIFSDRNIAHDKVVNVFNDVLPIAIRQDRMDATGRALDEAIFYACRKLSISDIEEIHEDQIELFTGYVLENLGPYITRIIRERS